MARYIATARAFDDHHDAIAYDAGGALSLIDKATENTLIDYIAGPMGTLARISSEFDPQTSIYGADDITYLHPDGCIFWFPKIARGSAQAGTKADGSIDWREQYTPFGEQIQNPAANDNLDGFTGHIKDKGTGLNYMQARYYDPVIGRFLSIDPVTFMDTGNPGYFNRYAYTFRRAGERMTEKKTENNSIFGKAKTVRELLHGTKYSIDYYQREYKWGTKQITELVTDLSSKFLQDFDETHERREVSKYRHYFLGSIIISQREGEKFIVDGQQRLTSLTLLLLYIRNLQQGRDDAVNIDEMIYSDEYGDPSFNLNVPDRNACLLSLYDQKTPNITDAQDSVRNIYGRYQDIEEVFPQILKEKALPYFVNWLERNVHLVEIIAFSDDDAYTIFETMNDRGLSLTQTEMLKGYLLANIREDARGGVNEEWKVLIRNLDDFGKDANPDFFKTWLRSRYATEIRPRGKGAQAKSFEKIGTEYHRWVRENKSTIGLSSNSEFLSFIRSDLNFYAALYSQIMTASLQMTDGLEPVFYNARNGFTLQHMVLMSPIEVSDGPKVIKQKLQIVARYIDILLTWRIWNFRQITFGTMHYAMFLVMNEIRGKSPEELVEILTEKLLEETENFDDHSEYYDPEIGLSLHQQNRRYLHNIVARMTRYIEVQSGMPCRYEEYINAKGVKHEVEHIWANKFERHTNEFDYAEHFAKHRNRIGGLLILPKTFNASYGDLPYSEKHKQYFGQNLLAQSLHTDAYKNNPGFLRFIERTNLDFHSIPKIGSEEIEFSKSDMDTRCRLYENLAKEIWNPSRLRSTLEG